MWKSAPELEAQLQSLPDISRANDLYALSTLWREAVYPEDYLADEEWPSALQPTPYGRQIMEDLQDALRDLPSPDVSLAFFGKFFHHDLFFDWDQTDLAKIRHLLEEDLRLERLRLPYRYGRLLYDRFNDTYQNTRTEHLLSHEVQGLVQGTPQGVYQLGTFVSGPLGIIDSLEPRYIPPSLSIPLWHCSDTGCNALHHVSLVPPSAPLVAAYSRIDKSLSDRDGPPSEWGQVLAWLHRGFKPRPPRPYIDLPLVIADCIVGRERTALVEAALLAPEGERLRSILAKPPRRRRDSQGPAGDVAATLASEAQLQLLMVLPDRTLVGLIDDAVHSHSFRVPVGEIRRAFYLPRRGPNDSASELSTLGIRSTGQDAGVNLISSIWRAYQHSGLTNELEWRVRGDAARSVHEALVAFVRNREPADTVRELILSSAGITREICEGLGIPLEHARGTDAVAVDRLLWKLGFNPMQFDEFIARFKSRLAEFNETILGSTPIDREDARARLRAAGVNVFVSVEEFLDRLISYNVWLLASDHFLGTHFRYSSPEARRSVALTLGATLTSGEQTLQWNVSGENALGSLLRYLRSAADWIQGLPEQDRRPHERAVCDMPHFADDERLRFPFRHVALWADADPSELRRHAESFARIAKVIEESELATVRNGLDHFREGDRFPSADKLLACVARVGQALELADTQRFLPNVMWLFGRKSNRFGSVEYEFRDYAGRSVVAYGPPLVSGLPRIRYESASLLAPGNLLGIPSSPLIFQMREPSDFSTYWQDYPRRRRIPLGNADDDAARPTELSPDSSSHEAS